MLGCRLEDFPPEVQRYSVVMRCILLALLAIALVCAEDQTPRERAEALLSQMTTEEKVHMLHGTLLRKDNYVGFVAQNERLGIPALRLNDGPQGFRDQGREQLDRLRHHELRVGCTRAIRLVGLGLASDVWLSI